MLCGNTPSSSRISNANYVCIRRQASQAASGPPGTGPLLEWTGVTVGKTIALRQRTSHRFVAM